MTNDKPLSGFELPPEFESALEEALTHARLLKDTEQEALAWIVERGLDIIKTYSSDSVSWLAKALNRPSEDEPMDEKARMFIWIVAYHIHKAAPAQLTSEQYEKWIFGLISLGYMMRIDHYESGKETGGTGT